MSGAPSSSEAAPHEAAPEPRSDVAGDAALIVAALGRMEAAVREERATVAKLRDALGGMANALARAKGALPPGTDATLLDEFEHRLDAMIEIAGATPRPMPEHPAAVRSESAEVPTVSGVVSQLTPDYPAASSASSADQQAPTVAMLTAMVQALSDSIAEPPPEPSAEVAPLPDVEAAPLSDAEMALLASMQQIEARPIPPPDGGTAVIFPPRVEFELRPAPAAEPLAPEPPAPAPPPEEAAPVETAPADDFDPSEFLFGPEPAPAEAAAASTPVPEPSVPEPPAPAAALTQTDFTAPEAEQPQEPNAVKQSEPEQPPRHDPLHALKAMTEAERIALFT